MGNPVWRHYVANHMESWLEWIRNIHLRSHLELFERFIGLNPHFVPSQHEGETEVKLVEKLMWNPEYINSLSDKGIQVWVVSSFSDFIDELRIYGERFREIGAVCDFLDSHLAWFERVYAFVRADIIQYLRNNGRDI